MSANFELVFCLCSCSIPMTSSFSIYKKAIVLSAEVTLRTEGRVFYEKEMAVDIIIHILCDGNKRPTNEDLGNCVVHYFKSMHPSKFRAHPPRYHRQTVQISVHKLGNPVMFSICLASRVIYTWILCNKCDERERFIVICLWRNFQWIITI